ncbi:unnamed protein product [Cyclocybe aegerita]|uniref:Uncharacterized protein n=1 Tax=Cyclocybe aegerita TaxID=1973307 RepID=A0A8S0W096_CYCAE|nr:unnamed protein product [Cyclocybe aegerita]
MAHAMPSPTTVCVDGISFAALGISWDRVTHVEASEFQMGCCLTLFRDAQAMTHFTLKTLWLYDDIPPDFSIPIVHTALRALKIHDGGHVGPLLDALQLPSLEEISGRSQH